MNTTKAAYKVSKMMELTNTSIFYIFIMQCLFSLVGATYSAMWTEEFGDDVTYLGFDKGTENYAKADITYIILTMTGSWILIFW